MSRAKMSLPKSHDNMTGQYGIGSMTKCPLKFWAVFGRNQRSESAFGFDGIRVRNQRSVLTESAFGISVRF